MIMASLKGNINGIVLTGTWISEGHTVTFTEHKEEGTVIHNEMIISESMRGNTWQTIGRNWSMSRTVDLDEAIEEQEKLIKFGYTRYN
jgi:hypothetical protein